MVLHAGEMLPITYRDTDTECNETFIILYGPILCFFFFLFLYFIYINNRFSFCLRCGCVNRSENCKLDWEKKSFAFRSPSFVNPLEALDNHLFLWLNRRRRTDALINIHTNLNHNRHCQILNTQFIAARRLQTCSVCLDNRRALF